jgi:hypothetical protein
MAIQQYAIASIRSLPFKPSFQQEHKDLAMDKETLGAFNQVPKH